MSKAAPAGFADPAEAQEGSSGTSTANDSQPNIKDITFGVLGPKLLARRLPVIPLNGKVPITGGWNKRRPTEEKVNRWAVEYPTANVGMLCGFDDLVAAYLDIY